MIVTRRCRDHVVRELGDQSLALGAGKIHYQVEVKVVPLLARSWGVAARAQGRERYYALIFDGRDGGGGVALIVETGPIATDAVRVTPL